MPFDRSCIKLSNDKETGSLTDPLEVHCTFINRDFNR